MVRTRLNIGCRYSTPVRERPLHPTRAYFTPEPSQTQAPVTPATEPERRAGGSLTILKPKCTKSAFRRVLRYVDEAILERMAERLAARPAELWPRVGDGLREGGGVLWGVTKPPGLQARSDTP